MRHALLLATLLASATACTGDDDDDGGSDGPGTWAAATPLPGGPRQETAVAELGGKVYVLGGFDEGANIVADVEVFDPALGTWASAAPFPVPMHHANAAVADGKLWVLGFLTTISFTADGRVFSYEPLADEWTERAPMPLGTERGSSGVAAIGNEIYVAGGYRDGAAVADFSVFTATTGTGGAWTGLPDVPATRDHLGAGAIDGVFYAIGGRNASLTTNVAELLAFTPGTPGSWSTRTPMPTARGGLSAAVMGGRLYAFGGEGNTELASGVFPDAERWDPATDQWTILEPMLTPRHGTGAATVGAQIWIPGGADEEIFAAVDTNESFTE